MENKKLLEKLSQMRKFFVVDRVRDKPGHGLCGGEGERNQTQAKKTQK